MNLEMNEGTFMKHMKQLTYLLMITACAFLAGCGTLEGDSTAAKDSTATNDGTAAADEEHSAGEDPKLIYERQVADRMALNEPPKEIITESHSDLKPAFFDGEFVPLSGDNTRIEFLGTKPDGDKHAGGFGFVEGKIRITPEREFQQLSIRILTKSLWSDAPKLTTHLKSPDFFDVNEHPEIIFKSTSLADDGDGKYTITGDLTMLGVTKEIAFPILMGATSKGFTLTSEFKVDRTQFGMNYGVDKIHADVGLTVTVGKESGPPADVKADAAK